MSWLARSIANSLKLDDPVDEPQPERSFAGESPPHSPSSPSSARGGGVKEDITELKKTLTRQFWGVASFLAPPPESPPAPAMDQIAEEDVIAGIRSDFAEIGGRFRSGISKLSSNKAVSEFTKIASNLLQIGEEDDEEARAAIGVSDEVVAFARNVALHPETWLDFPLPEDDESEEFELSDAQQEHALAVEHLAPTLAALRIELCPGHMSESHFWKIYFVLLHPRLNKHDSDLLTTPEIVEARAMLAHELQSRAKVNTETESSETSPKGISDSPKEQSLSVIEIIKAEPETEKHLVQSNDMKVVDKAVIEEGPPNPSASSSKTFDEKFEDEGDDWLKEDTSEMADVSGTSIPIGSEDDVSFSDLEDEDETIPVSYKKPIKGSSNAEMKEASDWLDVDDIDVV